MARLQIGSADDFMRQLEQLGAAGEEIGKKMVNAGLEVVEKKVIENYNKIPLTDRALGDVEKSITIKKAAVKSKKNDRRIVGYVSFKGEQNVYKSSGGRILPRKEPVRNGEVAALIEYGRQGQPARPFLRPAVEETEEECMKVMQQTFEDEKNKIVT